MVSYKQDTNSISSSSSYTEVLLDAVLNMYMMVKLNIFWAEDKINQSIPLLTQLSLQEMCSKTSLLVMEKILINNEDDLELTDVMVDYELYLTERSDPGLIYKLIDDYSKRNK